jgi:carboxyvinyl-carboxyphosphonate phosphorylmutase
MFFAGMKTKAELDAVSEQIDIPIMLGGASDELSDREYLASKNVKIALQGHIPFSASVGAVFETLKALREGISPKNISHSGSNEIMSKVLRHEKYDNWTNKYLGDV